MPIFATARSRAEFVDINVVAASGPFFRDGTRKRTGEKFRREPLLAEDVLRTALIGIRYVNLNNGGNRKCIYLRKKGMIIEFRNFDVWENEVLNWRKSFSLFTGKLFISSCLFSKWFPMASPSPGLCRGDYPSRHCSGTFLPVNT